MRILFICALGLIIAYAGATQARSNSTSDPHEFMILLTVSKASQCLVCSGSLVAKNWILTAAHCVHDVDFVVASLSAAFEDNCSRSTNISRSDIFIHPLFRTKEVFSGWSTALFHDIALIRFTPEITCDRISPVRLPDKNVKKKFYHNKSVLLVRLNSSCSQSPRLFSPRFSLATVENVIQDEYCPFYAEDSAIQFNGEPMEYDKLCVFPQKFSRSCLGDTSGHLLMPLTGELIGFMSNPKERNCGTFDNILFTQVSCYVPWIEDIISCVEKRKDFRCDGLPLIEKQDNENQPTDNNTTDPFAGTGFMVKLEVSKDRQCSVCSASFIAKNWIVTAAHCIHKANDVVAYIGPPFEGNCSNGHKIRQNDFFIHPSFAEKENELFNDIALIRFTYNTSCNRLSSVRLPDKNINKTFLFYENKSVLWFRFDASCGISPPIYVESARILQFGTFCLSENLSALKEDQLCVYTGRYENTNTCLGDASGHLIMPTGELVGLMSDQSARSCNPFDDLIFTHVGYHVSWIESVINCVEKGTDACDCLSLSEKKEVLQPTNNYIAESKADFEFIVRLKVAKGSQCSLCSAAFIAKNWILTTAHCIHGADSVVAYVGSPFEESKYSVGYHINNTYFYIHSCFAEIANTRDEIYKFSNDIALIKFTHDMQWNFTLGVPFAPLTDKNVRNELYKGVLLSRFGASCKEASAKPSVYSLNIDKHTYCRSDCPYIVPGPPKDADQLCLHVEHESLCYGDTSGLLFMPNFGKLFGFMSLSAKYCENNFDVIFTNVSYYIPWIEKVTNKPSKIY